MVSRMPGAPLSSELTVRDWGGPADAPTLVLLHGLGDSGACWPDAASRWTARWRVVSLDLLGHGTSPRFTAEQLAAPDPREEMYAAALAAVAELASQRGPVALVGHSMGGGVSTVLAARHPELVVAAVLEEPAWRDPVDRVVPAPAVADRIADCRMFVEDPAEAMAQGRRENPSWPEAELEPWARAKTEVDEDFLRLGVASFATPWEEFLAALSVPALAVIGGRSELLPPAVRERALGVGNPHLRLEVVPDAGHCVRRELPEVFHGLVDPWLETHVSPSPSPPPPLPTLGA